MATQIPLNKFKLIALNLVSGSNLIYQENVNDVSSIILSANITNVTDINQKVNVKITSGSVTSTILKGAWIPPEESLNPFIGKIVLERTTALYIEAYSGSALDCTVSILENANN